MRVASPRTQLWEKPASVRGGISAPARNRFGPERDVRFCEKPVPAGSWCGCAPPSPPFALCTAGTLAAARYGMKVCMYRSMNVNSHSRLGGHCFPSTFSVMGYDSPVDVHIYFTFPALVHKIICKLLSQSARLGGGGGR